MTIRTQSIVIHRTILVWLMLLGSFALAQGTYTQIDYPGALETYCLGINNTGKIVGKYSLSGLHGFLLHDQEFMSIDYPGSENLTEAYGINDDDIVVGLTYVTGFQGFAENIRSQSFTPIIDPGAAATYATAINSSGIIVGYWSDTVGGSSRAFQLKDDTFHKIVVPNADQTLAFGINSLGDVVGFAMSRHAADKSLNFILHDGVLRRIQYPTGPFLIVTGINTARDLVGYYDTSEAQVGFLYRSGVLMDIQFPGSQFTYLYGLNDAEDIVGVYTDGNGLNHGFVWTPPSAPRNGH